MQSKIFWTRRHAFLRAMEEAMCQEHSETPHNHNHKCPSCGHVWAHTENSLNCRECHTCSNCGELQFTVHEFAPAPAKFNFLCAQKGVDPAEFVEWVRENHPLDLDLVVNVK